MKKELRLKELVTLEDCFSLKGKNVVVIGGAGRMAESFSFSLLSADCESITLTDKSNPRLNTLNRKLTKASKNKKVYSFPCDVSDEKQVINLRNFLKKSKKKIDVSIYSVYSKPKDYYAPFTEYKFKTWEKALSDNLSGAFLVTQKLLPLMNSGSSLIFLSSIYGMVSPDLRIYKKVKHNIYGGKYPLTQPAVYSASKAGLIGFSRYMAVFLAEKNIRVNSLVPGGVYDGQDESFHKEYIKKVPLKRMAIWSDFNGAILYLASDASRYMTGQVLVVDGGLSAW